MKIRNGFVSNSSSSSFIVAFKSIPQTVKELKELLFNDNKSIMADCPGTKISTIKLAEIVFKDLQDQLSKPRTPQELNDDLFYWGYNNSDDELVKKFIEKNKECSFYVFEYGNELGNNAYEPDFDYTLEYGEIFKNLPHYTICNH